VLAAATILLVASATGCKRLEARNQLKQGSAGLQTGEIRRGHRPLSARREPRSTYPMTPALSGYRPYAQQVVSRPRYSRNLKTAQMAINGFLQGPPGASGRYHQPEADCPLNYDLKKFGEAPGLAAQSPAGRPQKMLKRPTPSASLTGPSVSERHPRAAERRLQDAHAETFGQNAQNFCP